MVCLLEEVWGWGWGWWGWLDEASLLMFKELDGVDFNNGGGDDSGDDDDDEGDGSDTER